MTTYVILTSCLRSVPSGCSRHLLCVNTSRRGRAACCSQLATGRLSARNVFCECLARTRWSNASPRSWMQAVHSQCADQSSGQVSHDVVHCNLHPSSISSTVVYSGIRITGQLNNLDCRPPGCSSPVFIYLPTVTMKLSTAAPFSRHSSQWRMYICPVTYIRHYSERYSNGQKNLQETLLWMQVLFTTEYYRWELIIDNVNRYHSGDRSLLDASL